MREWVAGWAIFTAEILKDPQRRPGKRRSNAELRTFNFEWGKEPAERLDPPVEAERVGPGNRNKKCLFALAQKTLRKCAIFGVSTAKNAEKRVFLFRIGGLGGNEEGLDECVDGVGFGFDGRFEA